MRTHLQGVGLGAVRTKEALESDWRGFEEWCSFVGRNPCPAKEDTVELYAVHCAGESRHALSTIERRLWAVARWHREHGFESPCNAGVRAVMRGLARERGRDQSRKDAITIPELRKMVRTLDGRTYAGARDQAVLLLGFSTGLRASDLSGLQFSGVRVLRDRVDVRVARSKTDQEGYGRSIAVLRGSGSLDAVAGVERWIRFRGVDPGPFFGVCTKWPWCVVKAAAKAAGLDASRFGAHSLRAGMMTELDRAGASLPVIMQRSGHRSVQVAMRYVRHRDGAVSVDPLAISIEGRGRRAG